MSRRALEPGGKVLSLSFPRRIRSMRGRWLAGSVQFKPRSRKSSDAAFGPPGGIPDPTKRAQFLNTLALSSATASIRLSYFLEVFDGQIVHRCFADQEPDCLAERQPVTATQCQGHDFCADLRLCFVEN